MISILRAFHIFHTRDIPVDVIIEIVMFDFRRKTLQVSILRQSIHPAVFPGITHQESSWG